MNSNIYIRPLRIDDAGISYKWRNDPEVWKFTGSRPDREITPEIERAWLAEVLERSNEKRFAICLADSDKYIGNVQLTNIEDDQGEFHIFIGDKAYWGKGVGSAATTLLVELAFGELGLTRVHLSVKKENRRAIGAYEKVGFGKVEESPAGYFVYEIIAD